METPQHRIADPWEGNSPVTSGYPYIGPSHVQDGSMSWYHHDVIKWKHFPRYLPFVRGIHWSPVNSPHKGQWRGALMFSLICVWINDWVNNREAGELRPHRSQYYVTVMSRCLCILIYISHMIYIPRDVAYTIKMNLRAKRYSKSYIPERKLHFHTKTTSSNGKIFRVTGHLLGESPVTCEFPSQKPVT